MASRSNRRAMSQPERALWRDVLIADLSREGRVHSINKRIDRASPCSAIANALLGALPVRLSDVSLAEYSQSTEGIMKTSSLAIQSVPEVRRPVRTPRYVNTHLADFRQWYVQNEPFLSEYFQALVAIEPEGCDFWEFAVIQHEREVMLAGESAMPNLSQLAPLRAV